MKHSILALIVVGLTAIAAHAQNAAPAVEMISADELKAKVTSNQPVTMRHTAPPIEAASTKPQPINRTN